MTVTQSKACNPFPFQGDAPRWPVKPRSLALYGRSTFRKSYLRHRRDRLLHIPVLRPSMPSSSLSEQLMTDVTYATSTYRVTLRASGLISFPAYPFAPRGYPELLEAG